ncbi:YceI family protein [Leptospira sp. 'Mane']|uniref:YceI family protein n=1 Tax=Leptospira sp. 'Mane' TaxID=3387407 RepID=UPI00398A9354
MSGFKSIFAAGLVVASLSGAYAQNFKVDNTHSSVGFKIKHLGIATVTGSFKDFDAKFSFDEKTNSLSIVDATIQVDSINTNDAKRDDHLKSKDFFDEDKFPTISFKVSKPISVKKGSVAKVPGELTIKGVTKPAILNVKYTGIAKDPWGNTKLGFEADTKIKRADFGITWNKALETGGVLVGEEVDIKIEGEAAASAQ